MNCVIKKDFDDLFKRDLDIERLEGKVLLFVGATSFLMSYFIKGLLYYNDFKAKSKIKIIGVVRNEIKANSCFKDYLFRNDFNLLVQDIVQPFETMEKIDVIINAASQASPKYYGIDPVGTINANIVGNYNLLEFAKKNNIKDYIYISSGEVYGNPTMDGAGETDFGITDCATLRACYSEGKRAAETMCVAYAHQYGINTKMLRLFHTYAPFMPLDDGRIYADFANNLLNNQDIILHSDGSAVRPFCYVIDMIDGLIRVLLKGEKGNAYNVANPNETYSILEFAELVCREFKDRGVSVAFDIPVEKNTGYIKSTINGSRPSIAKLKALGFKPEITLKDGFRRVIESYGER